jgi:drug/metabolite transporter (DMT)-like permease
MLVAFLCNGMGPFGLKVLAENNLSDAYHYQFIAAYYFCGFLLIIPVVAAARIRPTAKEFLIAAAMGASSFGGTLFTAFALERGAPGEVVFPITTGGSLIVVAIAGLLLFKEKVAWQGAAGILIGILALVLLSMA